MERYVDKTQSLIPDGHAREGFRNHFLAILIVMWHVVEPYLADPQYLCFYNRVVEAHIAKVIQLTRPMPRVGIKLPIEVKDAYSEPGVNFYHAIKFKSLPSILKHGLKSREGLRQLSNSKWFPKKEEHLSEYYIFASASCESAAIGYASGVYHNDYHCCLHKKDGLCDCPSHGVEVNALGVVLQIRVPTRVLDQAFRHNNNLDLRALSQRQENGNLRPFFRATSQRFNHDHSLGPINKNVFQEKFKDLDEHIASYYNEIAIDPNDATLTGIIFIPGSNAICGGVSHEECTGFDSKKTQKHPLCPGCSAGRRCRGQDFGIRYNVSILAQ